MSYAKKRLTPYRTLVWDLLRQSDSFYLNHHIIEVDVTRLNQYREACRQKGITVPTYIAFVLEAIGKTIRKHPIFNSYLRTFPLKRLFLYRSIDITFTMEKECAGENVVILGKIRDADKKSPEEIQDILLDYKTKRCEEIEEFKDLNQFYAKIPPCIRRLFFGILVKPFPEKIRRIGGTVAFTSVGKFGVLFTTPLSMRSALFSMGKIEERPVCIDGEIKVRPMVYITLTYDHRIADGATAARLSNDLKDYLENFPLPSRAAS